MSFLYRLQMKNLILEINPQFYLAICRQIQYEIGETYTEMADLKISLTEHQGTV